MKPILDKKLLIATVKRILKYYKSTLCVTVSILGVFGILMFSGSTLLRYKVALPDYFVSALVVFGFAFIWLLTMSNGLLNIVAESERAKEKAANNCENKTSSPVPSQAGEAHA